MKKATKRAIAMTTTLLAMAAEAAEIYQCKTHQGGGYWSSEWCSKSGGITTNAVTVPSGMPFKEQVEMAQHGVRSQSSNTTQRDKLRETSFKCRTIDEELAAIWKPYGAAQHVPADQVGRDRNRTRELKAQRANLGCQTQ